MNPKRRNGVVSSRQPRLFPTWLSWRVSPEQRISTCQKGRSCDYKDKDGLRVPSAPQVLGEGGGPLFNNLAVVLHQLTRNYRPTPGTRLPGFVQGNQPTSSVEMKTLATFWPKHYTKARAHTHVFKVSTHMCDCVSQTLRASLSTF